MTDIRQTPQWGRFLSQIGWKSAKIGRIQIMIRPIRFLNCSIIKIQRPLNPVPFLEIDRLAKKSRALFVLIEPEIDNYKEEDFKKYGFSPSVLSLTHTATIQINLWQSAENLWKSLSENARRNIKKAQKNNLKIQKIFLKKEGDDKEFKKFYQLVDNLTKIKKFYNPGFDEFYKKMISFKNNSIIFFAYQPNKPTPIGGVWVSFLKDKMSYLHTGITKEGYDLMATYLLVWEALKVARDLKLRVFDFEGIFDPRFPKERKKWKNFSEFKKRFHGAVVQYPPPWIKCYNPLFKFIYLCNRIFYR